MNFNEALEMMKKGKKVKRSNWGIKEYLELCMGGFYLVDDDCITEEYFFGIEDFETKDWEETREYCAFPSCFSRLIYDGRKIAHKDWEENEYLELDPNITGIISKVKNINGEIEREIWTVNSTPKEHEQILSEYWYIVED